MRLLCFIALLCQLKLFSTLTADCNFKYERLALIKQKNVCEVRSSFEIVSRNLTTIEKVIGAPKPKEPVTVFKVQRRNVFYFPKGLEKLFTELEGVSISSCHLQEVHQADLKPLPKLVFLDLSDNKIKVIVDGLFDFNGNLQLIWLKRNEIHHIGPRAFNKLPNLRNLIAFGNNCTNNTQSENTYKATKPEDIGTVIMNLNMTCVNQQYLKEMADMSLKKNSTALPSPGNGNLSVLTSKIEALVNSTDLISSIGNKTATTAAIDDKDGTQLLILLAKYLLEMSKAQQEEKQAALERQEEFQRNFVSNISRHTHSEVEALKQDLVSKIDAIREGFNVTQANMQAVQEEVQDNNGEINVLNIKIEDLNKEVGTNFGNLNAAIESLNATVLEAIEKDHGDLDWKIGEIKDKVNDGHGKMEAIKVEIGNLNDTFNTNFKHANTTYRDIMNSFDSVLGKVFTPATKTEPTTPITATPDPATAASDPATAASDPATAAFDPATAASDPATAAFDPATAASDPATAASDPATAASDPATSSTNPEIIASSPTTEPTSESIDPTTE